jgi:hypothetical protein
MRSAWEILTHDLALFGGILPRVLAGCLLGAFIAEILPQGRGNPRRAGSGVFDRGGGAEGRRHAAGDRVCDRLGAVCLQRLLLWEIPFMPARFVWFRAAVSLPFPFLAAAISMAIGRP